MANKHRGEVALGDHTLVLSVNAICELEQAFGMPVARLGEKLGGDDASITDLRRIVWAGLQEKHDGLTEKDAGRIIGAVGLDETVRAIGEAFSAAFPSQEDGAARPRTAAA